MDNIKCNLSGSDFKKCGDIFFCEEKKSYALHCNYCYDIFWHFTQFMRHLQYKHCDEVDIQEKCVTYSVEELLDEHNIIGNQCASITQNEIKKEQTVSNTTKKLLNQKFLNISCQSDTKEIQSYKYNTENEQVEITNNFENISIGLNNQNIKNVLQDVKQSVFNMQFEPKLVCCAKSMTSTNQVEIDKENNCFTLNDSCDNNTDISGIENIKPNWAKRFGHQNIKKATPKRFLNKIAKPTIQKKKVIQQMNTVRKRIESVLKKKPKINITNVEILPSIEVVRNLHETEQNKIISEQNVTRKIFYNNGQKVDHQSENNDGLKFVLKDKTEANNCIAPEKMPCSPLLERNVCDKFEDVDKLISPYIRSINIANKVQLQQKFDAKITSLNPNEKKATPASKNNKHKEITVSNSDESLYALLAVVGLQVIQMPNFEENLTFDKFETVRNKARQFALLLKDFTSLWQVNNIKSSTTDLMNFIRCINEKFSTNLTISELKRILNAVTLWYTKQCNIQFLAKKKILPAFEFYIKLFSFMPKTMRRKYHCEYCDYQFTDVMKYTSHRKGHETDS